MSSTATSLLCPVCSEENSELSAVCFSCGSYIQNRVPTLDLFETAWGVLEHPVRTYGTIARAEHKNYAFFLFALGGILPTMASFHYFQVGRFFPSLLTILPLGVILGVLLGLIAAPIMAGVVAFFSKVTGGEGSFRNALGAVSYAFVPTILIGILTLPIQWLTFGEYQFTLNPHPDTINAVSYWSLNVLQGISVIWTVALLVQGIRISMRLTRQKAMVPAAGMIVIVGGGWVGVFTLAVAALAYADLYYTY